VSSVPIPVASPPTRLRAYGLALAALLLAVLLRWLLDPILGMQLPLVTLFGAIAAAVWAGGFLPATLVTILGYLIINVLVMDPRGAFVVFTKDRVVGLLAYLFTSGIIIALGEAMRRAQARATQGREVLRVTLQSIGDAVITTDTSARIASMNTVAETLTGWRSEEAAGRPLDEVFRIVNETTRAPAENPATRALREGSVVGLANHTMLIRRDGSECAIDDSSAPIRDEAGQVAGCVLIFRDVTAQRRLEHDLAHQLLGARMLASIVETSDDAIISKSLDGTIRSWNRGAERLFGHRADEAIGGHISMVIPPDRLQEEDEILANLRSGRRIEHFETERVRSDGTRVLVALTISPLQDESGAVIGASKIVRDITDRKRFESERQRFVTLIESSTDFIAMSDLEGVPFFINRAGLEMVGLESIEQASQVSIADFFFPEDRDFVMGEFLPRVLGRGHGETEIRFRHFRSGAARWMAYKAMTLRDDAGRPVGFGTVSQDVTNRRELEDSLRGLAADLSEANNRKDEFLAMLAHELRNPLAPISNAVQVLRLRDGRGGVGHDVDDMLHRQVRQMSRLVDDLLDVSRINRGTIELRPEPIDLGTVVRQAAEASQIWCDEREHHLVVSLPEESLTLQGDSARLAQVIGNLINNACKFTERGGRIHLEVERDGAHAVIKVRDNGIGILPEQHGQIFEMFRQVDSSLERSRDGLGIGLTLVKSLVESHGGTVQVRSEGLGRGSEFELRLPLADQPLVAPEDAGDQVQAQRRRILIVDDNVDSARSLAMLLELSGHETHTAHDGVAGLEAAERLAPDLVLLDIGLPGLNGYEVCRRIRQANWGQAMIVVALTGWGQEEDRSRSREAGFTAHLVKPVDLTAITRLLSTLS
jgi:PAS domain S-box-containing protein